MSWRGRDTRQNADAAPGKGGGERRHPRRPLVAIRHDIPNGTAPWLDAGGCEGKAEKGSPRASKAFWSTALAHDIVLEQWSTGHGTFHYVHVYLGKGRAILRTRAHRPGLAIRTWRRDEREGGRCVLRYVGLLDFLLKALLGKGGAGIGWGIHRIGQDEDEDEKANSRRILLPRLPSGQHEKAKQTPFFSPSSAFFFSRSPPGAGSACGLTLAGGPAYAEMGRRERPTRWRMHLHGTRAHVCLCVFLCVRVRVRVGGNAQREVGK